MRKPHVINHLSVGKKIARVEENDSDLDINHVILNVGRI